VDAASVKARALTVQLKAAQQQIADLTEETEANRASSMARSSVQSRGRKTAHGRKRGRVVVMAGLALFFIALIVWSTVSMTLFASNEPIPPLAVSSETMTGPGVADLERPLATPETSSLFLDPATGGLDPDRATQSAEAQDLVAAHDRVALLTLEVEASDNMIARLRDELAFTRQAVESARKTTSGEARADTNLLQRDLMLAATVSTARAAALQRDLKAAKQQIDDLKTVASSAEEEVVRLRNELADRQQSAAATRPTTAPSGQNSIAGQDGTDQPREAEDVEGILQIEEVLTVAEMPSNPLTSQTIAVRDTVSPDDLLIEPGHHFGREVVVTGSVVWLLQRYWLQSESGHKSMVIGIEDLHLDDRNKLKDDVAKIEYLAQVRARITGTVERQGSENYRLAATQFELIE